MEKLAVVYWGKRGNGTRKEARNEKKTTTGSDEYSTGRESRFENEEKKAIA